MTAELRPALSRLRELRQASIHFLHDLAETGFVEGVAPPPRVKPLRGPFSDFSLSQSMCALERVLNPGRARHGDPALTRATTCSPLGRRHLLVLARSIREIHDGFSAFLDHWSLERYWGCGACAFQTKGVVSTGLDECAIFEEPESGYPVVPRVVFDAMMHATNELAACIRAVEQAVEERPDLFANLPGIVAARPSDPPSERSRSAAVSRGGDGEARGERVNASDTRGRNQKCPVPRNLDELKRLQKRVNHGVRRGETKAECVRGFVEEAYPKLTSESGIKAKVGALLRALNRYKGLLG